MRSYFTLLLVALFAHSLAAQPIRKPKYDELLEFAHQLYAQKDYYNALEKFEEAYDEKKDRALTLPIAQLHYLLRDYSKAERWYDRLLKRDKENKYAEERYMYGRVLKMNGVYQEAISELQLFIEETENDSLRSLAQMEIAGAQLALEMPENTSAVEIVNVGRDVNSSFSEYSPALARGGNELYFAAFDTKGVIIVDDPSDDKIFAKIYQAKKEEDGWSKPTALEPKINRPGVHNSNVSISPDGNTMFITRAVLQGNELKDSKIYFCVGGEGAWNGANEVQGINGDYIVKDPVVGELFGREVLFFTSDMPGGYGGYDLYYATRTGDGAYDDPVNLGEALNTVADEETPFYFDGTLYFSSTGHPGLGGYDLFYSVWDGTKWSDPANMGKGFNTEVDDKALFMSEDGYTGFLTSNREGGRSTHGKTCCDDIYSFEIAKLYADLVAGVFDEKKQVIKGATVELVQVINDQRGKAEAKTNDKGNRFDFGLELEYAYMLVASKEGYFPDSTTFNTVGLEESKTFQQHFFLKAKPVPPPEPEYDTITLEEAFVLENILYDFDSDRIKEEAESDLQVVFELMTEYPDMKIELSSHTDYRGDDAYNEDLSQRRAESARRWLIRKGIPRGRIEAKGYGENKPQSVTKQTAFRHELLKEGDVLTNGFIDSLSDNTAMEAAHDLNRRTEFKIIEGPTSITIKRTRLRKNSKKPAPRRNALPKRTVVPASDTTKIDKLSSLHGRNVTQGVPIMKFKERMVDFGKVPKGEKRYHIYEFTNVGDTDLVIANHIACECTTVDYSLRAVKPGETGEIDVTFDSSEKDGEEIITFELFLENTVPGTREPIIEKLQYKFEVIEN